MGGAELEIDDFAPRTPLTRMLNRLSGMAALARAKPLVLVHEADEAKGGAPLDELQQECEAHSEGEGSGGSAGHLCPPEAAARLFGAAARVELVTWVRRAAGASICALLPRCAPPSLS